MVMSHGDEALGVSNFMLKHLQEGGDVICGQMFVSGLRFVADSDTVKI